MMGTLRGPNDPHGKPTREEERAARFEPTKPLDEMTFDVESAPKTEEPEPPEDPQQE